MNSHQLALITEAARSYWLAQPDKYQPQHWELETAIGAARSHLTRLTAHIADITHTIDTTQPATSEVAE
jgi:hypothetical protein